MIILLNGTSSAGKTTIAKKLQDLHEGVLLYYGVDMMVQGAMPEKCDLPPWNEKAITLRMTEIDGRPLATLDVSPYMFPLYKSAVVFYKTLSNLGYDIIVDEVLFNPERIAPYFELLEDETVYFIGVKPNKDVVAKREELRGDRILGLALGLYEEVYDPLFSYDLQLDTGAISPEEAADIILGYLKKENQPTAFRDTARRWLHERAIS